jgi:hypothetical protein
MPTSSALARTLLACFVLASLAGCSSASDPRGDLANAIGGDGDQTVLLDPAGDSARPRDPVTIDSARVTGDSLFAYVTHGGGCAQHSYQLVVSTIWMESFPVQVPARISHDANGDNCKALLRREVGFSLAPLADAYRRGYQQTSGSISLRLSGSNASLIYRF